MSGSQVRVEIVPHLAQALALRQEHDEPVDGRRKGRPTTRARPLAQQRDDFRMSREEFELRGERDPKPLERPPDWIRQFPPRRLQLAGRLCQHRLEETAFRVEVVEQELLVDAGQARDLIDSRTGETPLGKLFAGGRYDP